MKMVNLSPQCGCHGEGKSVYLIVVVREVEPVDLIMGVMREANR